MRPTKLLCNFAAATMLFPTLAMAQGLTLQSAFNQKNWPEAAKIADLPQDYQAASIKMNGSGNPGIGQTTGSTALILLSYVGASGGADRQVQILDLLALLEFSWTRGETVTLAGAEHMITYRYELAFSEVAEVVSNPAGLAEIPLRLTFVKVSEIQSLSPRPDVGRVFERSTAPTPQSGSPTMNAMKTATLANVKQMSLGMIIYCTDYDDVAPYAQSSTTAWSVMLPYIKSRETLKTLNPNGGSFLFNMSLAGVSLVDLESPAETPMIFESKPWPDGTRAVAFADGHAKYLSEDEWAKYQPALKLNLKKTAKKPLPSNYDPSRLGGGG